jgi:hypothetical protein
MDPSIFQDMIVWEDYRNGNWDIYLMFLDRDNDGVSDDWDAFPDNQNEFMDFDLDGVGDQADFDDDNDGVVDTMDHFPFDPTEWQDYDRDWIGDNLDTDDDNDGLLDTEDPNPMNPYDVIYSKLDEIIIRMIYLGSDMTTRLDELETGILSELEYLNRTIQEDMKDDLKGILLKLEDLETLALEIEDDIDEEESNLKALISEHHEDLSQDFLDMEEMIDLGFSMLRAYIDLINLSLSDEIENMGSDIEIGLMTNITEIQSMMADLQKMNDIIKDLEEINDNIEVQREAIDDSGSSNTTFLIIILILMTLYAAALFIVIFRDKIAWKIDEKD